MTAPEVIPQRYEAHVPLDRLTPHPANSNQGDLGLLCDLVDANGFAGAVLAQESTGLLIDGEHRWKAALEKGMSGLPVLWLDVDDDTRDRLLASLNESTRRGRNDEAKLVDLLTGLAQTPRGLEGAAFDGDDLDELIAGLNGEQQGGGPSSGSGDPDEIPEPPAKPVTQPGDIWLLGPNRIICGDCRDFGTLEKLLGGTRVNVAFTSPPYASQRAYDESSGFRPIPPDEYTDWFEDVQSGVRAVLADDGSWFVNIKASADELDTYLYVHDLVIAHVRRWGWHYATEFCWERPDVPKSVTRRFKNKFEPVYQFTPGAWKMRPENVMHHTDSARVPLGAGAGDTGWATDQGNGGVLARNEIREGMAYPGNLLPTFQGTHEAVGHTAAFPVGLPAFFIRAYSDPGDTVFDPFMGSGSTLIAAHQENRTAYGCEISAAYCDVICKRFERFAGIKPERVLPDGTTEPVSFTTDQP